MSFYKFVNLLVGIKVLIVNDEDKGVFEFLKRNELLGIKIIKISPSKIKEKLKLKVLGAHNQSNAQMVVALGNLLGLDKNLIKDSLTDYGGIGRRLELIGEKNGIKVYDDYAHHPVEISAVPAVTAVMRRDSRVAPVWRPDANRQRGSAGAARGRGAAARRRRS